MSSVANVLLCFETAERDVGHDGNIPALEPIQAFLKGQGELRDISDAAGGNKAMEAEVWAGAFNALDQDAFIHTVAHAPWKDTYCVQLLIKIHAEDKFTIHRFGNCGSSDRIHTLGSTGR